MKSTNTKWFTLVELIIVITILAVLATIAFISFQWYTKEARDSSKKTEISNIIDAIAINEAKSSVPLSNYIQWTASTWTISNIQWKTTGEVSTGTLNTSILKLNTDNTYEIAVYDWLWVYQIRAAMENTEENWDYYIAWTYFPRTNVAVSGSVNWTTLTITNNLWILEIWDVLGDSNTTNTGTITAISSNLATITLNNTTTLTGSALTLELESSPEAASLFN